MDCVYNGDTIDDILFDFSKAFVLVPHDRLPTKIGISGVDSNVDACERLFFLCRTQGLRLGGQLSVEVRLTSGVPQGNVLGPLLFLA